MIIVDGESRSSVSAYLQGGTNCLRYETSSK